MVMGFKGFMGSCTGIPQTGVAAPGLIHLNKFSIGVVRDVSLVVSVNFALVDSSVRLLQRALSLTALAAIVTPHTLLNMHLASFEMKVN